MSRNSVEFGNTAFDYLVSRSLTAWFPNELSAPLHHSKCRSAFDRAGPISLHLISKNIPSFPEITPRFRFRGAFAAACCHSTVIDFTPERKR
jgi:hypothetical protein